VTRPPDPSRAPGDARGKALPTPAERVALVADLCAKKGLRLTQVRRQVLELLWEGTCPRGAYELIQALEKRTGRKVAPPTVYRALDFLMAQGFVTKIESSNTYTPCAHPDRPHDCLFFLCSGCGTSMELDDPGLEQRLAEDASRLGFRVTRRVVEVQGTCADCLAANPL